MKMQLKENVEFRNLTVNCNTFKEKVSELVEQFGGKVAFVFKSEVMHQISKKGLCKYYTEGYTADDGICMIITHGSMLLDKVAYTIYPFDLFNAEKCAGVESIITAIYDKRGIVKYNLPLRNEKLQYIYCLLYTLTLPTNRKL